MYLVILTLTLAGGLAAARWFAEPPCPACSAKSWRDRPQRLQCGRCGWSHVAATLPTAPSAPQQIDLRWVHHGDAAAHSRAATSSPQYELSLSYR
jgi:hypothetical protein